MMVAKCVDVRASAVVVQHTAWASYLFAGILRATPISLNGTYPFSAGYHPTVYNDENNRADCDVEIIVITAKRVKLGHRDSQPTMSFDSCVEDAHKAVCASIVCN